MLFVLRVELSNLIVRLDGKLVKRWSLRKLAGIVLVACVVGGGLLVVPSLLGIIWFPELGGWCFVSAPLSPNRNVSYSVLFHSVNFTFLYSTGDPIAHFMVRFGDGAVESLTLRYDGCMALGVFIINYHWNSTSHVYPRASVLTGNSWVLAGGWQFVVAP